eukprot:396455-Amphidinium_carterae.1
MLEAVDSVEVDVSLEAVEGPVEDEVEVWDDELDTVVNDVDVIDVMLETVASVVYEVEVWDDELDTIVNEVDVLPEAVDAVVYEVDVLLEAVEGPVEDE